MANRSRPTGRSSRIREEWYDAQPSVGGKLHAVLEGFDQLGGEFASNIEHLDELNDGQRAVAILAWAIAMIDGDGFKQVYVFGQDGLAENLAWAAERIGATPYRDLFRRAEAVLPGHTRRDCEARDEWLYEQDVGIFDWADREYYRYDGENETNLAVWMVAYIDQHPEEFFLFGD